MFILVENSSQFQFKIVNIHRFRKDKASKLVEYNGTDLDWRMNWFYFWNYFSIEDLLTSLHKYFRDELKYLFLLVLLLSTFFPFVWIISLVKNFATLFKHSRWCSYFMSQSFAYILWRFCLNISVSSSMKGIYMLSK